MHLEKKKNLRGYLLFKTWLGAHLIEGLPHADLLLKTMKSPIESISLLGVSFNVPVLGTFGGGR